MHARGIKLLIPSTNSFKHIDQMLNQKITLHDVGFMLGKDQHNIGSTPRVYWDILYFT